MAILASFLSSHGSVGAERGGLSYDGFLDVSLQPGHPFLEFFVPGMIARPEGVEGPLVDPFRLTAHGNLNFSDAATSLALHDVTVRGMACRCP